MKEFFARILQQITHLDNAIVRTLHDLPLPGKMTVAYFRGKRKRYPHPLQLFFVMMFFFLLFAGKTITKGSKISVNGGNGQSINVKEADGTEFYFFLNEQVRSLQLLRLADSLPAELRTPVARQAIDTLIRRSHSPMLQRFQEQTIKLELSNTIRDTKHLDSVANARPWTALDSITIGLGYRDIRLAIEDIVNLKETELLERYHVDGMFNRQLLKQAIKTLHDPLELVKFYLGSLSWTILALVALMSAVLYGLYRRQRRYFVEHFVFLLHWHSGFLLLATLLSILAGFIKSPLIAPVFLAWTVISLFWAMRRYYQGAWFGTIWRYLLFGLIYLLCFAAMFLFSFFAALALF